MKHFRCPQCDAKCSAEGEIIPTCRKSHKRCEMKEVEEFNGTHK